MVTGSQMECHAVRQKTEQENGEKMKGNGEDGRKEKSGTADKSVTLLESTEYSFLCSLFDRIIVELEERERETERCA